MFMLSERSGLGWMRNKLFRNKQLLSCSLVLAEAQQLCREFGIQKQTKLYVYFMLFDCSLDLLGTRAKFSFPYLLRVSVKVVGQLVYKEAKHPTRVPGGNVLVAQLRK